MECETVDRCIICGSPSIHSIDARVRLYRCRDCGVVFDNPRPCAQDIERFYSATSRYNEWLNELPCRDALWRRRLTRVQAITPSGKLLDVGAGIGQFLKIAQPTFDIYGTEISDTAIQIAQTRFGITLVKGELEDLSLPHQFDVITLIHVLEHVPYPGVLLERCQDLLKNGGIMVIAVPNDLGSYLMRSRGVWDRLPLGSHQRGKYGIHPLTLDGTLAEIHLSHFSPVVLRHRLNNLGFVLVEESLDPAFVNTGTQAGEAN